MERTNSRRVKGQQYLKSLDFGNKNTKIRWQLLVTFSMYVMKANITPRSQKKAERGIIYFVILKIFSFLSANETTFKDRWFIEHHVCTSARADRSVKQSVT